MILYDYVLSPCCYRARLMASLVGERLETVAVDFHPGAEQRSLAFRAINPAGTIPVLVDGELTLTDSGAILSYLARKRAPEWMGGDEPATAARVQEWLGFAQALNGSLGAARLHDMLGRPADIDAVRSRGVACLRQIEAALFEGGLAGRDWLAADRPTIADIACFPHVALAPDGGVSLDAYPKIRLWLRAVRALPGFIEMPGIHRLHDLHPEPLPAVAEDAVSA